MTAGRPPVRLTARALTFGSLGAAALLALGFTLGLAGAVDVGKLLGNIGVIALLLTPVVGLVATWWELRPMRPAHARIAVAVLGVLLVATLIALLFRP